MVGVFYHIVQDKRWFPASQVGELVTYYILVNKILVPDASLIRTQDKIRFLGFRFDFWGAKNTT